MMKIILADKAGFCYGVRKAVGLAEDAASRQTGAIYMLGHLIHNRLEVKRLSSIGVKVKRVGSKLKRGTLIIRTHGVPKNMIKEAGKKSINVIDATCPVVKRIHRLVEHLSANGYNIIVVGEKNHPETVGIVSYSSTPVEIVDSPEEIKRLKIKPPVAVVSQTTQNVKRFKELVAGIRKKYGDIKEYNTICNASAQRQRNAGFLAKKVNVMVVIGGKDSANTRRLKEICSKYVKTYHVESARELKKQWFKGAKSAGVTAGASTPGWLIDEVTGWLKAL